MLNRLFIVFALVLGMLALTAVPAFAHEIDNATATVNCDSYTVTVSGSGLGADRNACGLRGLDRLVVYDTRNLIQQYGNIRLKSSRNTTY
jgi:hypothetical protein